jgi:predicted ester cyclase
MLVMALAMVGGCKKKENAAPKGEAPKAEPKPTETKPAETKPPVEAPKALTGEQRGARYVECMGFWSAHDEAKFKTCLAPDGTIEIMDSGIPAASGDAGFAVVKAYWTGLTDVKVEPQIVLVSGTTVVSVDWVHGTHDGEFNGIPATNKKVGYLMTHVVDTTEEGLATKAQAFFDMSTLLGQIGLNPAPHRPALEKGLVEKPVIIVAKDSPEETANIAVAKAGVAGVNTHSLDAYTASLSDDSMESDWTAPADIKGKADLGKHVKQFFTALPDVKLDVGRTLAAGDYVVNVGKISGTNTGDMPEWGLKKTGKKIDVHYVEVMKVTGGKVAETWRFWNALAMATQLGLVPPPDAKK